MGNILQSEILNSEKSVFYASKLDSINSHLRKFSFDGMDRNTEYMIRNLGRMYNMMVDCEQYDLSVNADDPELKDRVIRVYRPISKEFNNLHGMTKIVLGGLYVIAPLYFLPADRILKCMSSNRSKGILNPEEYGLPPESVVKYGTTKFLDSSVAVAMPNHVGCPLFDDYILTASHYDYVVMG